MASLPSCCEAYRSLDVIEITRVLGESLAIHKAQDSDTDGRTNGSAQHKEPGISRVRPPWDVDIGYLDHGPYRQRLEHHKGVSAKIPGDAIRIIRVDTRPISSVRADDESAVLLNLPTNLRVECAMVDPVSPNEQHEPAPLRIARVLWESRPSSSCSSPRTLNPHKNW